MITVTVVVDRDGKRENWSQSGDHVFAELENKIKIWKSDGKKEAVMLIDGKPRQILSLLLDLVKSKRLHMSEGSWKIPQFFYFIADKAEAEFLLQTWATTAQLLKNNGVFKAKPAFSLDNDMLLVGDLSIDREQVVAFSIVEKGKCELEIIPDDGKSIAASDEIQTEDEQVQTETKRTSKKGGVQPTEILTPLLKILGRSAGPAFVADVLAEMNRVMQPTPFDLEIQGNITRFEKKIHSVMKHVNGAGWVNRNGSHQKRTWQLSKKGVKALKHIEEMGWPLKDEPLNPYIDKVDMRIEGIREIKFD